MKFMMASILAVGGIVAMSACSPLPPLGQAYWQRVEDNSALYMTGPKAQQQLDEHIATCVRVVDELVELDALREALPPDTHSEYHRALNASGDLDYYETPTRYGAKKVAHSDFHDFEGCMRSKGWERVKFVRYQTSLKSGTTFRETQQYRKIGLTGEAAVAHEQAAIEKINRDFAAVNQ
ncbi:MAG: hypothetical protein V1721_03935 [Pseudomonadota bacterium]